MANTPKQTIKFQKPIMTLSKSQLAKLDKKQLAVHRRSTLVFTPVNIDESKSTFDVEIRVSECHPEDAFVRKEGIKNAFAKKPRYVVANVSFDGYRDIITTVVSIFTYQLNKRTRIFSELNDIDKRDELMTDISMYTESVKLNLLNAGIKIK